MMYLGNDPIALVTSIPKFADIAKIECGEYTPTQDVSVETVPFYHSLGSVPDFIFVYADPFTIENFGKYYFIHGYVCLHNSPSEVDTSCWYFIVHTSNTSASTGSSRAAKTKDDCMTQTAMTFPPTTSKDILFKPNITYHYIIGKFKEVTPHA